MKSSDIDVLLMLFAITPEERKRGGAASSGHSRKRSRLGDYFSDRFMDPFGKTALTPYRN